MRAPGGALLVRGDALHLPLADESADLIVTSPPFFALRSYTDAGQHYTGQLGDEPTPAEFLANLWAATREMARVLKPSGSMFIELGDKYVSQGGLIGGQRTSSGGQYIRHGKSDTTTPRVNAAEAGVPTKSLMGLPWAYALGCTGALAMLGGPDPGLHLILRAEVIHEHVNGLPESVKDRVRRSHSTWFHLVKQPRYYAGIDEIREPHRHQRRDEWGAATQDPANGFGHNEARMGNNPLGKLPGSVWSIPSEPLRVPEHLGIQHYAAFSSEIVRRIVLGWSPPGICCECGQGRAPVVDKRAVPTQATNDYYPDDPSRKLATSGWGERGLNGRSRTEGTILGYACACTPSTLHADRRGKSWHDHTRDAETGGNHDGASRKAAYNERLANPPLPVREYHLDGWKAPPTRPAVILDPFVGTGTTVGVAKTLGRIGIGVDLSADYLRLATWRVFHSGDFGKAEARTWRERQGALL